MTAGFLAFLVAVFLLGVLAGAPIWTALAIREQERRQRLAWRRLRELTRE